MKNKKGCYSNTECTPNVYVCPYCRFYQNKEEGIISRDITFKEHEWHCPECGFIVTSADMSQCRIPPEERYCRCGSYYSNFNYHTIKITDEKS